MNYTITQKALKLATVGAIALLGALIVFAPAKARAFDPGQLIDPLCLFACDDTPSQPTIQNVTNTNSYNTNSFNNVTTNTTTTVPPTTGTNNSGSYYSNTNVIHIEDQHANHAVAYNNNGYYGYNSQPYYNPQPIYVAPTYNPVYTPVYTTPSYNYQYTQSIAVSCNPNTTSAATGSTVSWTANVSGGNGYYTYTWSGTDGLYGSQAISSINYGNPGIKTAMIYVQSGGQQVSAQCSNVVNVSPQTYGYNYNYNYTAPIAYNTAEIACFADKTSTQIGVPVTWAVEAAGMGPNLTYAWTGTDGLSGNQGSVITTYVNSGLKSAVVTVTSPNGQSQSKACGNTVNVRSATVAAPANPAGNFPPAQVQDNSNNGLSAASLFSIKNVPWGLVGILVIIILFVTVIYLLLNKKKI